MRVVLTGATGGLGTSLTLGLLGKARELVILHRDEQRYQSWRQTIPGPSETALFPIEADLSSIVDLQRGIRRIEESGSPIDLIIHNAASLTPRPVLTSEGVDHMFAVNVLAPYLLCRKLLPLLQAAESPQILLLGSDAHRWAKPFDPAVWPGPNSRSVLRNYGIQKLVSI
ncbi:MAG: SDR family NAD(P)-dependent oxidoreductase, partial [Verrucomicrobiota bacterium]